MATKVVYVVVDQYGNRHEVVGSPEWSVEDAKPRLAETLNKGRRKKLVPIEVKDIVDMKPHSRPPILKEPKR